MTRVKPVFVAVVVASFFLAASYGCLFGPPSARPPVRESTVGMSEYLSVMVVSTDKYSYLPGDPVNITALFTGSYFGMFPSTITMYYMILDCDGHVVFRQPVYGAMVLTYWGAQPGYSRSFTWNQKDNAGNQVESPKWLKAAVIVPAYSNPLNVSCDFEINPLPTSFDLSLAPGWNHVSLPLVNDSHMAGSIGFAAGTVVASWNSFTQSYSGVFVVGASPESADFKMAAGAYFVWSPMAQSVAVHGCSPTYFSQFVVDLAVPSDGGWVCTGFKSLGSGLHASDVAQIVKGPKVLIICLWDSKLSIYKTYIPRATPPAYDFEVGPGTGCWMCLDGPGKLTYSP